MVDQAIASWIGQEVRAARRAIPRMTQARLAAKADIARETVYRVERGRMASPHVLARICDVLGVERGRFDFNTAATDGFKLLPELMLLRERRRSLGLSLAKCASAAGVSEATLSRFERGVERSRAIATFNAKGEPIRLINAPLAAILQYRDLEQMTVHWRTGRL